MAVVKEYLPHYTYEDYRYWEGRWEIIDGVAFAMSPMAMPAHQYISGKINQLLNEQLEECKVCKAFLPIDWHISEDTIVQPDNLVICYKPTGSYITKAPKIIFEVVSKRSIKKDEVLKFELYEKEGVGYYILVYPNERLAKVFKLMNGKYVKELDATEEKYIFEIEKCQIEFDFSRIWYDF